MLEGEYIKVLTEINQRKHWIYAKYITTTARLLQTFSESAPAAEVQASLDDPYPSNKFRQYRAEGLF